MRGSSIARNVVVAAATLSVSIAALHVFWLHNSGNAPQPPPQTVRTIRDVLGDEDRRVAAPPGPCPLSANTSTPESGAVSPPRQLPAVSSVIDPSSTIQKTGPWLRTAHTCTGRSFVTKGEVPVSAQNAHCMFANLCIAPGKGTPPRSKRTRGHYDWYYIYDDATAPPSKDSISFSLGVGWHKILKNLYVQPEVITSTQFAAAFPQVRYEPALSHIYHEYNGENFGHVIADVLFPIFAAMAGFGVLTPDMQLFRYQLTHNIGSGCDWQSNPGNDDEKWEGWKPNEITRENRYRHCVAMKKKFTPAITTRPLLVMGELFNASKLPVCFAKVLLGTPMLSDDCDDGSNGINLEKLNPCNYGRMEQFWAYRQFLKTNLGVADQLPSEHHVVIWERSDPKRGIKDLPGLGEAIRKRFKIKVTLVDFAELTIQDQLRLIGGATVHITGVGGGSFIGLFLPRGASHIRLASVSKDFAMDQQFFNFVGHIHTEHRHAPNHVINRTDIVGLVSAALTRYELLGGGWSHSNASVVAAGRAPEAPQPSRSARKPLQHQSPPPPPPRDDRTGRSAAASVLDTHSTFVTFDWNKGRMGNQLRTLAYACSLAKALGAAVLIPKPNGMNSLIGLNPNREARALWDSGRLRDRLPVVFVSDIPADHWLRTSNLSACGIGSACPKTDKLSQTWHCTDVNRSVRDRMSLPKQGHLSAAVGVVKQTLVDAGCQLIYLGDDGRTVPPHQARRPSWLMGQLDPFVLYDALRPQKWLADAVSKAFNAVKWQKPVVGMHKRDPFEKRPEPNAKWTFDNNTKCREKWYVKWQRWHEWVSDDPDGEEAAIVCTLLPHEINRAWSHRRIPFSTTNMTGRWLLASDRSGCYKHLDPADPGACPLHDLLTADHHAELLTVPKEFSRYPQDEFTDFKRMAAPLFDLWSLTLVDYFFGSISTFDEAVCGFRGARLVNESNFCPGIMRLRELSENAP
eukprot:m.23702 g.23702  ORF g.23702 m.23702 type:complete len:967 (+) comp5989_c0_seq1:64-2964(+)